MRTAFRFVLGALSIAAIWMFAGLGARRLAYPLELDCIEGVIMDHIVRLASGQPIYVAPSLDFIPLAYMPLYTTVCSWLVRAFEPALWQPRVVSLLSVATIVVLIGTIVRAETRSVAMGLAAAAIYLMAFGATGSCYDVARPDSLMLALALGGLAVLRFGRGTASALGAAALLVLAFFTKQHALLLGLGGAAYLAVHDRARFKPFALALVLGCVGGFALLAWRLGPWFVYYTWEVPSGWSQPSVGRVLNYLGHDLAGTFGLLTGPALLSLALNPRPWRSGTQALWMWVAIGAAGTGMLATLDPFAYRHTLMPTALAAAIIGPIALHRLAEQAAESGPTRAWMATAGVCVVLGLQFAPLLYTVRDHLPHDRAAEARDMFVADLRRLPGEVIVPYHGYYEWSAGKGTSLNVIALDDLTRTRRNRLLRKDPQYFERLLDPLRHGPGRPTIVTDQPLAESGEPWASIDSSYTLAGQLGWISETLRPVTGNRFTPTYVYVPNDRPVSSGPDHVWHELLEEASAGAVTPSQRPRKRS